MDGIGFRSGRAGPDPEGPCVPADPRHRGSVASVSPARTGTTTTNARPPVPAPAQLRLFEKRSDLVRFLTVADTGRIGMAADRLAMTQPALTRVIARLEHQFGGRLFERLPVGVRLTALGATVAGFARRILREFQAADDTLAAARAGRTGRFRVTAGPIWSEAVLTEAIARFHEAFPGVEIELATTTRAEGLRRLADGESDLHCGGIDAGELLPDFLRRERFLHMTAGIVARHDHPLLARRVTNDDLARCPWIDYDAPWTTAPDDGRPSLAALLERLHATTRTRVRTVVRTGTAGLFLMEKGPYLTWLSLTFLERLPGLCLRPLPVAFGRYCYRSGFVARRSAEDLPPFRRFQAIVRDTALGRQA